MDKLFLTEVILLTKSNNLKDFCDWMHWHLDIVKFDHCHIFDNESSVDIKSICDKYGDKVSYENIPYFPPQQYDLYNRYINDESNAWWVLPIDDDEFLWMKNFENVNDMILHYQAKWPDMNKLSIRWKNMFPNNPFEKRGEISLMDFCKNSNEEWANLFDGGNKPVKTFVRTTNKVNHSIQINNQTHNPITNGEASYLCNGDRLVGNWYYGNGDDDLKILHYQFKSNDEWNWKCLNRLPGSTCKQCNYNYRHLYNIALKMK